MLLEYYRMLIRVCEDIHVRYRSYVEENENPEGSANLKAPSNISFYIENTQTKKSYTNLGVNSVATARVAIEEDPELTMLFDGVRTLNIMVANSENTLNARAATWFIDTVFLGANERVVIAVDRSYPVGDVLREDYLDYQRREPVVIAALIVTILAAALLLLCLAGSILTTGRKNRSELIGLKGFDLIPTEIAAGICVITMLLWFYLFRTVLRFRIPARYFTAGRAAFWVILYWFALMSLLSLVRRIKWKTVWPNSVLSTVVRVSAQVLEARVTSARTLIIFAVFMLANFFFLRFFGTVGVVIVIVLDLAMLLYLMADQLGKVSVRAGLRELSEGKLDYRIDTTPLTGDSLEMAEAVNEMGDGLQEAVDSIVRSERLKAELITNVSHDLKTPLTSIINYVDLLKREDLQNEKAREYIDILDRKSQRLKTLIADLIEASRINSGNVELDMTELDLRSMVQMAAGEFEDRFEELRLKVEFSEKIPGQKLMIRADGSQLWRVLDNLLSNIVKYAKEDSSVRITLSGEDKTASVLFENESSEELLKSGEELEERFVRGDSSRNSEGSGLGLSIAGSLTELMGGTFAVTTEGTMFRAEVKFPML
jgi:signal transduction histidine kinase